MKILFIYPTIDCPPGISHGLAAMSGLLKTHGHQCSLIHINESLAPIPTHEEIIEKILYEKPDLIGFSVMTQQFEWTCNLTSALKKHNTLKTMPLVIGGVHCTMVPEEVTNLKLFDYVCVGEGDFALLELMNRLERGESTKDCPNMRVLDGDQVLYNKVQSFPDLNELPFTDYELFDMDHIINVKKGWLSIITSRGCPYKCTYCFNKEIVDQYKEDGAVKGVKEYLRHYSIERIIDEIKTLKANHPHISTIIFDDDLFTLNRQYVHEFSKAYKEADIGLWWVCNAHVDAFSEQMAKDLSEGGCRIVKFGVESGSAEIRKNVLWRYMTNKKIIESFHNAHKYNLHTSAFIMFGLPLENRTHIMETFQLCADAQMGRFRWALFFPFPGTMGYTIANQHQLIDFEKMKMLGNYFDGTCLKFDEEHNLFLSKIARLANWWVNSLTSWECAPLYQELVKKVEAMSREEWNAEKEKLVAHDRILSNELMEKNILHYTIRYAHVMGVRSDFIQWKTNK
jgi:anaerobic magnesium-protoporphyrin IX monomethyl ester cyclase